MAWYRPLAGMSAEQKGGITIDPALLRD